MLAPCWGHLGGDGDDGGDDDGDDDDDDNGNLCLGPRHPKLNDPGRR